MNPNILYRNYSICSGSSHFGGGSSSRLDIVYRFRPLNLYKRVNEPSSSNSDVSNVLGGQLSLI